MINLRSFEVPTVVKHAPGAITCLADQVKAHPRIIMQEVTVANRNQLLAQVYDHLSRHLAF